MASEKTKKVLNNYLRKLTNLSGRNRSLFLPRLSSEQFVDIQELSQLNGDKAFTIIESLIANKKKVLCSVLDPRMEAINEASRKLKKIQRADHFIFEERGSRELHIGWPFVRGKLSDGTLIRCPLLYFPVELKIENSLWILKLREEAEISYNKSFLLAYSYYNQVNPAEELLNESFEDWDVDSTVFRTQLYQQLQKANLAIHFNADNYRDELISFWPFKKDEFEERHQNGELKLFPEAVLGIFPQAGSFLVPDYQQLLEDDSFNDLEEFFNVRSPIEKKLLSTEILDKVKEERVYSIFPMDSWQERALKASKLGYSLVVEGPPGTGKSQLICNLISDAIAQGKRVLVVCQKRAALDVVFARLREKNLTDFIALVHDYKNDRKEIFQKTAKQIERVEEYKTKNISLDAIHLDRQFFQLGKRIDAVSEEIESFRTALFNLEDCGLSIKQLYLMSDSCKPAINLRQECNEFKTIEIASFIRTLKSYCYYAQRLEDRDYLWKERKSFANYSTGDRQILANCLEELPIYFNEVKEKFSDQFKTQLDWEQCEALIDKRLEAISVKELLFTDDRYRYFQKMVSESDEETSALWLANIERVSMECYEGVGIEQSIPAAQLGHLQRALYKSMKARRSLFGLIRWELFSKDKYLVKRALVGGNLDSSKEGLLLLEKKLDQRLNLEHNLSKLRTKDWLLHVPDGFSKTTLSAWFSDQQSVIKAKLIFSSIRGIKNLISTVQERKNFVIQVDSLFRLVSQLPGKKDQWLNYLLSSQISDLTQIAGRSQQLRDALLQDFDSLVVFDQLKGALSSIERAIIEKLYDKLQQWDATEMVTLFENSIYLAWIYHLETKYPQLRMASTGQLSLLENELKDLINEKQTISTEILLLRSRERVTDELEFNRLNNRVTYRDLLHQVTKKKKIWPLRKVITDFELDIFKLLPCWLASPESVSAIFPMRDIFDLVIFDEASQCYAERGVPALFRGKQALVAGDSQQLKPGDFYQARWQEDDDEPETEIDSLLELSNRFLPSVQLQGHYRSKSLALMEFSNRHFYQGKLQMLPELKVANRKEPAIDYLKVEGEWKNYTNEVEADRVVVMVKELTIAYPDKEIGVITFNAPQQSLILDKLEESLTVDGNEMPASLFVKNIENVQGDERDIIIFSIGYAPDKRGVVAAQFGSLNMSGGENRLNVAVSRAREKVIVITSLWPEQLNVDGTKNDGPKLLKAYLQFALDVSKGKFKRNASSTDSKDIYLKNKIKDWFANKEFKMETDVLPYYDLTVKKDEQILGAILTDDDLYFQSLSAKSIHALVPQVLETKNWPFLQVYSRNYWLDKDRFFNEVGKFILSNS